jgi:carboxyl-terminal processing protease
MESKDFSYTAEDIAEVKKRNVENKMTLNKAARDKEIADADVKRHERNKERMARFAEVENADKASTKFYKLSLADIADDKPPHLYDPAAENTDYMRKAKDETDDLDDTPKWPSGMDSVKREGISILCDLAEMTAAAKTAGVLKKTADR